MQNPLGVYLSTDELRLLYQLILDAIGTDLIGEQNEEIYGDLAGAFRREHRARTQ